MKFLSAASLSVTFAASVFLTIVATPGTTTAWAQPQPQPQQRLTYFQRVEAARRMMAQAESSSTEDVSGPILEDIRRVRDSLLRLSLPEVLSAVSQAIQSTSEDVVSAGEDAWRGALEENLAALGAEQAQAGAPNFTVSELCVNHTAAAVAGMINGSQWAIQMLDAMGKPGPGLKRQDLNWPGAYQECHDVRAVDTSAVNQSDFSGRYCTAYLQLNTVLQIILPTQMKIALGVCVPDSCSGTDLTFLVYSALINMNVTTIPSLYVACSEPDLPLDTRAYVAIVVCVFFLLFIVTGTILDIVYVQMPAWKKAEEEKREASLANGHIDEERRPLVGNKKPRLAIDPPRLGPWGKVCAAFSVYTNGSKLFSTQQAPGSLDCVHGIRFLSMTWVVLGHVFMFPAVSIGINVIPYFTDISKRWTFQAILNASVSVDTFFVLSGLLVAYLSLREMARNRGKINWFLFYFHRFWRLTPAYMLVIMLYLCLSPYMSQGPFWAAENPDRDNCKTTWWTNLLYINNLVDAKKMCLGQSWYLSNDMQFYILSPLIFVPFYFSARLGALSSAVFLLVTAITPGVLTAKDEFSPYQGNTTGQKDYMTDFYIKPYNRMGPYVVGMLAGYFLYRTDCKLRINKVVNLVLWAVATASALAVLYGLYDHRLSLSEAALYNAVNRQVWGACVCWVVVACVTGNGGFVNTLLSWSALVPLSRLTYCIYLIHILVIELYLFNRNTVFYVDDINLVMLFLSCLVACYLVAVVVSLAFEAPMMALEKILFHSSSKPKVPSKPVGDGSSTSDGKPGST